VPILWVWRKKRRRIGLFLKWLVWLFFRS